MTTLWLAGLAGLLAAGPHDPPRDTPQDAARRAPQDTALVVRAGRLLDPATGRVHRDVVLVIRAGRIAERIDGARRWRAPAAARVVDLGARTVLPGLIDTHVHLTLGGGARANARATVRAGFTSAADLGSAGGAGARLRELVEGDTAVAGPRILAAGSWIGGRGGVCEFGQATVRGAAEADARAAADLVAGADLLKVCVTGWLDAAVRWPDSVEVTREELAAVAARARGAGVPLAAHAIGARGVREALGAGVRLLAHTPVVDSAGAAAIAAAGACVSTTATTLLAGEHAAALRASFQRLRRAGVRLAFGTDAGVLPHGQNARELATLRALGMTPLEAIRSATVVAAECLGLGAAHVALRPGSPADLIAVAGDPLEDLTLLERPVLVVKGGRLIGDEAPRTR